MILALLLAANPATFADVAKKFPALVLPVNSNEVATSTSALKLTDLAPLGLPKPPKGEKSTFTPLGSITGLGFPVLLVRQDRPTDSTTTLLTFTREGAPLDRLQFTTRTLDGTTESAATLTASGSIGVKTITRHPGPSTEPLVVRAERQGKLTAAGHFEWAAPTYTSRDGKYVDPRTAEELWSLGQQLTYRATGTSPPLSVFRDGDAIRFKAEGKPYQLTWDERRTTITCANADGSLQIFTRQW